MTRARVQQQQPVITIGLGGSALSVTLAEPSSALAVSDDLWWWCVVVELSSAAELDDGFALPSVAVSPVELIPPFLLKPAGFEPPSSSSPPPLLPPPSSVSPWFSSSASICVTSRSRYFFESRVPSALRSIDSATIAPVLPSRSFTWTM